MDRRARAGEAVCDERLRDEVRGRPVPKTNLCLVSDQLLMDATDALNRRRRFTLDELPDECPICHVHGQQIQEDQAFIRAGWELYTVLRCPRKQCDAVYYGIYNIKSLIEESGFAGEAIYKRSAPSTPQQYDVPESLEALSPRFAEIVGQAAASDSMGWTEVAGPGYRKALEFLIKDYLIKSKFADDPEKQAQVREKQLMPCINMLDDGNVKSVATRATWLGNDETHYDRRWSEMEIKDLKALLRLTILHIDADLQTREFLAAMPEGR